MLNLCGQKRDLVQTKAKYPEYKDVYSDVLQDVVGRVKKTFERFIKGDSAGKRSGKPRFKPSRRYRSFTYPWIKANCIQGKYITQHQILCGLTSAPSTILNAGLNYVAAV